MSLESSVWVGSIGVVLALTACGPSVPPRETVPRETVPRESVPPESIPPETGAPETDAPPQPVEAPAELEADSPQAEVDAPDTAPTDPEAPEVPEPIDHTTPCFAGARLRHTAPHAGQERGDGLGVTVRTSAPISAAGEIRARPRDVIRVELAIENRGEPIVLDRNGVAMLRRIHVLGSGANLPLPIEAARPLRAGHRLARGGVLRLCATFDVGDAPFDAAPESRGEERTYALSWAFPARSGAGYHVLAQQTVSVRYEPSREPVVREPESWGGVIAIRVRRGADLAVIARESGVRLGAGVQPFDRGARGGARPAPVDYVQAPPQLRVRDVAAALAARPDVVSATPLMRGDPGTEGCSEHSPCDPGQSCCYLCGIAGCPNSCYAGPSCPMGIP